MRVIASKAGKIVVEHDDGYTFVFQVRAVDDLVMDLVEVHWPIIGPPPDADDLELDARRLVEIEAREQGWL